MGYNTVILDVVARSTGDRLTFERALQGGAVRVRGIASDGIAIPEVTIPAKQNAADSQTLSGALLRLSGLWGREVRQNQLGRRRSLSFRDIAFLCVVDEERIISERPPHLSGEGIQKTVETEVLRLLVRGAESEQVPVAPDKEEMAGVEAKIELVDTIIDQRIDELRRLGISEESIDPALIELEEMRARALAEYEQARLSVTGVEEELSKEARNLRSAQSRSAVVDSLLERFSLLSEHYDADINRLAAIEETGSLLELVESKRCPICGAPPESHELEHAGQKYELNAVRAAAGAESEKIRDLRRDLQNVIAESENERAELTARTANLTRTVERVQAQLDRELVPRARATAHVIRDQTARRDVLISARAVAQQLRELRSTANELRTSQEAGKIERPKVRNRASSSEMNAFTETVQSLLESWRTEIRGRAWTRRTSKI